MSDRPRTVVAEDQYLLRDGLTHLLAAHGFDVVAAVATGPELVAALREHRPDVSIVDVRMPPSYTDEGLRAAHQIRARHPEVGVLLLSQYVETEFAVELVSAGAQRLGYLLKDRVANVQEFTDAVRRVGAGGSVIDPEVVARLVGRARVASPIDDLTVREKEVLGLMAEGRSNAAIAGRIFVTEKAVSKHINSIFSKLGLPPSDDDNRRVLAVLAYLNA